MNTAFIPSIGSVVTCISSSTSNSSCPQKSPLTPLTLSLLPPILFTPSISLAADGPLPDLFKTIPANLAHPALMWALFGTAVYTFYLGYQSRQLRTTDDAELKKKLAKDKPGQKHFMISSAVMAAMTIGTFEGMANTFNRAGKLFPGPHLYVGLGLVSLMTVMAALVPSMQKPNANAARNAHASMAVVALGLFGWQAQTGMDIVAKILKW